MGARSRPTRRRNPGIDQTTLNPADWIRVTARTWTEDQLLREIQADCRKLGIFSTHFRPGMMVSGRWVTPLSGDKGYPDLTLAYRGAVLWAELKREGEKPTPEQVAWRDHLPADRYRLWRPSNYLDGSVGADLRMLILEGSAGGRDGSSSVIRAASR